MARQHHHFFQTFATLVMMSVASPCWAGAPEILLPEPFAIELPAGITTLGEGDGPVRELLAGITTARQRVTVAFPRGRVGAGAWRVILSLWSADEHGRPAARREAVLVVLPHGLTPVGETGTGATARIVRDSSSSVHIVWTDGWRAGGREGAMYRRAHVSPDGTVRFDTDIQPLGPHPGNWSASPVVAAAGTTVHFAWQADGTVRYRSLTKTGSEWRWSEEIDTKMPNPENGPAIQVAAGVVHIVTSAGQYATSRDAGGTWTIETVPFGVNRRLGSVSLSLDASRRPLVAASVLVNEAVRTAEGKGAGDDWTLRLVRRTGPGVWETLPGPLERQPEWAAPARPDESVIAGSFLATEDKSGAIHAVWGGSPAGAEAAVAWYGWRPPGGEWQRPISLVEADPVHGLGRSSVAGLVVNKDAAMPLVSMELHSGWRYRGSDTRVYLFKGGQRSGVSWPLTNFLRDAMEGGESAAALSTAAGSPAMTPVEGQDGHLWNDVPLTLSSPIAKAPGIIVWRQLDVTAVR